MSGGYGWSDDRSGSGYSDYSSPRYSDAYRRLDDPPKAGWSGVTSGGSPRSLPAGSRPMSVRGPASAALPVATGRNIGTLTAKHRLASKARNVIILAQDMTGSMGEWPQEVISRGGLLSDKLEELLGSADNEILILGFGDGPLGDPNPIEVAPELANDARLADYLASLSQQHGFGNIAESADLAIQYVMRNLDTSTAANVFFLLVTDEKAYDASRKSDIKELLGREPEELPLETAAAIAHLRTRMEFYVLLCDTGSYEGGVSAEIAEWWKRTAGAEGVIPIEFKYKVVETVLGLVAKRIGRVDKFIDDVVSRHRGTKFGDVNVASIRKSLSFVPDAGSTKALAPVKSRKSILTIGDDEE